GTAPTLADVDYCMQSEIPTLDRIHRLELTARRGRGCVARRIRIDDASGATRGEKWEAPRRTDVRHGYFTFLRYLPGEREDLGWIEREFFARAERIVGLDPKRVYDDQWLCAAGQLFLVSSGTMRMCADVRGWLARATRRETVASHPYDLCTSLAATEAGSPVLEVDDAL